MSRLRQHPWRRRLAALTLGFALLALLEGTLRLAGWGRPDPASDPFTAFESTRPLFTVDPLSNTYVTAPERLKFFIKDRFPRLKAKNVYRIFCLGGSTVQGRPFSTETAFSSWLRLGLESAYPRRRFQVVNAGGVSYASYRLVPILQECLAYQPDLIVVCTGQNEFLEARTYHEAQAWEELHEWASHLHLYHGLNRLLPRRAGTDPSRPVLKEEVDALLDQRGGLQAYHRNDRLHQDIRRHHQNNLRRMIALAKRAGIPLLFLRPPVNLKDCPPFKSETTTPANLTLLEKARSTPDLDRQIELLDEALSREPRSALLHFEKGRSLLRQEQFPAAETAFWRAVEEDLCPLRQPMAFTHDLQQVCRETATPLIDLHRLLAQSCPGGIPGDDVLLDHIHPSIPGHQEIAAALQDFLIPVLGPPGKEWVTRRQDAFSRHLAALDPRYFRHGNQRLRNLRLWTQGRADGPPYRSDSRPSRPQSQP